MGQQRWTTTSDQYLNPTAGDAWAAEAAASGQRGTQRILVVETIPATEEIARHLRLHTGMPIVARQRLILADDEPVEVATSYWPGFIAEGTALAKPRKIPGGAASLLAELGYKPSEVREDISAAPAVTATSLGEREAMRLSSRDPVLVLTRIQLDETGRPFQVDVNVMRAGRHIRYVRQTG